MDNVVTCRYFNLWLHDNKDKYYRRPVQILANEDGMFDRPFTDEELRIYYRAHEDYLKQRKKQAAHGSVTALNDLWDLFKRGGLAESEYAQIKRWYNGEDEQGLYDFENSD
ncbi:hypothetical protein HLB25_21400 [Dickeya dadantii]|uniref:hypothetical protein n=1 Tax=Dickeya dadantii TaxID=204038 RepID=UPI0014957289|nr:hypothetical protein [Dickeya dadantii]NPE57105.1 hypothetical protein [Dickeya dadantii]NPE69065.1 hypothetical protein [Dickeya dadantii]